MIGDRDFIQLYRFFKKLFEALDESARLEPKEPSEEEKCQRFIKEHQLESRAKDFIFDFIFKSQKDLTEKKITLSGAFFFIYMPSFQVFKEGQEVSEADQAMMDTEWEKFSNKMTYLQE